jgi:hypothetical protein
MDIQEVGWGSMDWIDPTKSWVGPGAGLNILDKPYRDSNPGPVSP